MKLEKIAEIYSDENDPAAPSIGTFIALAMHKKELAAKEKAESALLTILTLKQRRLFEIYKDAWTEIDTILELEAFRQGVIMAEKKKSGHSLKVEDDR